MICKHILTLVASIVSLEKRSSGIDIERDLHEIFWPSG